MKRAAKEAFDNNILRNGTMKTITRTYLSNDECSVQKTLCYIFSELNLRNIFTAVYFVNTNLLEKKVQVLLSEKELSMQPEDGINIFKIFKSNIDCFKGIPSAIFCNGK